MSEIDKLVVLLDAAKEDCLKASIVRKAIRKPEQKGKKPTKDESAAIAKFEKELEAAEKVEHEAAVKVEVLQVLCKTGLGFDDINGVISEPKQKGGK